MSGGPDPLYIGARTALLDVIDALREPARRTHHRGDVSRRRSAGPETLRWPDPIGGRGTSRLLDGEVAQGHSAGTPPGPPPGPCACQEVSPTKPTVRPSSDGFAHRACRLQLLAG